MVQFGFVSVLVPSEFSDCVMALICLFSTANLSCCPCRLSACKAFREGTCNQKLKSWWFRLNSEATVYITASYLELVTSIRGRKVTVAKQNQTHRHAVVFFRSTLQNCTVATRSCSWGKRAPVSREFINATHQSRLD